VVQRATLAGFAPGEALALGRAVALELLGDDDAWHVLPPLEPLAQKLLGGLLVPAALHQDSQYVVVLVDSAPPGMALAMAGQADCIKRPFGPWWGASTLQLRRVILPPLAPPWAEGFMGDVDPACAQQLLDSVVAGLLVKRGQLTRPSFGVPRTFGASRPGSLPLAEGPLCPQAQSLALGMYQL
jgi:hypothetical protein